MIELGHWLGISVEGPTANISIAEAAPDTMVLVTRPRETPLGKLPLIIDRAVSIARRWLEKVT